MTEDMKELVERRPKPAGSDVEGAENELAVHSTAEDELGEENYEDTGNEPAARSTVPISELRKVRAEAARYRRQLRDLEGKMDRERKATELAEMEETARLKAIAEEAEVKAKLYKERACEVAKRSAIVAKASALGFHNPMDAASLIDSRQIEADEDGNVLAVDEDLVDKLVRELAESRPYLVRGRDNEAGLPGEFGPTNPASASWPRPKLRTKDQIDRLKQQSNESMRRGRIAEAVRLYNRAWEMERGTKRKGEG